MKYIVSNDNQEYVADEVSLVCEIGCDFTLKSGNQKTLDDIIGYVRTLPNDEHFMAELGTNFINLVHKYVSERVPK